MTNHNEPQVFPGHSHVTKNIKPLNECWACDRYHYKVITNAYATFQKECGQLKLAFQSLQSGFELDKLKKENVSLRENFKIAVDALE
jgi:hypothetical protein